MADKQLFSANDMPFKTSLNDTDRVIVGDSSENTSMMDVSVLSNELKAKLGLGECAYLNTGFAPNEILPNNGWMYTGSVAVIDGSGLSPELKNTGFNKNFSDANGMNTFGYNGDATTIARTNHSHFNKYGVQTIIQKKEPFSTEVIVISATEIFENIPTMDLNTSYIYGAMDVAVYDDIPFNAPPGVILKERIHDGISLAMNKIETAPYAYEYYVNTISIKSPGSAPWDMTKKYNILISWFNYPMKRIFTV